MIRMARGLFGTSGIRGSAKDLLTSEFCFHIGKTFVEFLRKHNNLSALAVGTDTRESSPRIKADLFKGLATGNTELYDEGVVPIPSVNWLIKNTEVKAAVMVTGSHIAPDLNGLKFYAHEEEISYKDEREIEAIYSRVKEKRMAATARVNVLTDTRALSLYKNKLLNEISPKLRKMKVAVDCANGGQSVMAPGILKDLGFEVVEVNCDIEQDFIARDTDTDDQAVIEDLKYAVVKEGCDFGVAFDGDGDRVVFIDEKGNFIQGEYSCSLVAKEQKVNSVVTTISASQVVDKLDMKVYRTRVGSPYVIGEMKDKNVKFGFEPNGGAIFADSMYTRDGGTMMMKMINLFNNFDGKFSEMFDRLPKYYMARTKVEYKWEQKDKILEEVKKEFKGIKTEDLDGIKIWLDKDTWILFRSSANAPEFRVFAESLSDNNSKDLLKKGIGLVNHVIARG